MSSEIHLFIVWQHATPCLHKIIEDLSGSMCIRKLIKINWSLSLFSENLTRFYGQNLPPNCGKEQHIGKGPFHVIIVEDRNPSYGSRQTSKGAAKVNTNIYDLKQAFRTMTGGGHKIHATNTNEEVQHDIWLLLGEDPKDFLRLPRWDGTIPEIDKDLVGAKGWQSIPEFFEIFNNLTQYVVLRNFECLPDSYHLDSHGDIDLLVDNLEEAVFLSNAKKVFVEKNRVHFHVTINGSLVPFDFRYVGDDYYDRKFQEKILQDRRLMPGGFYAPSPIDYFYSLLYHALIHKPSFSKDYTKRLINIGSEVSIEFGGEANEGIKLLTELFQQEEFHVVRAIDRSVHYNEGVASKMGKDELISKNHTEAGSTNDWQRPEYQGIADNGDECERRLKGIIESASDVSVMSMELAGRCSDWPTRYHLSRQRSNILRPFEEQLRHKKVLEIGAGCGAITRYLGEVGAEVLALEDSTRRASIAASRCRDLKNVTVVAEAIHQFQPIAQFDVVTLIGVFEYTRKFFLDDGKDPVDTMLKYVRGFLRPGGKLILAIENQLGLKYFAGFPEDHMGKSMFGIEEHYRSQNMVAFGRKDLFERIRKAGLTQVQWWYPFPDYKLPSLMITDQGAVPRDDMDLFPVVRNACSQDPQYPWRVSFNQERAWRSVMRNGLLKDMANSFVVVASDIEIPETLNQPLAIHFATNRRPEFSKKVLFSRTKEGAPMTHQVPLYPQAIPKADSLVKLRLENQAFLKGLLWQERLVDIMTTPDWEIDQVQKWFQIWVQSFCRVVGLADISKLKGTKISGKYIDLLPRNMIVAQNGGSNFIDQEWEYLEEIDLGYVIFRALNTSIGEPNIVSRPRDNANLQVFPLMKKVAEGVGYIFTESDIGYFHKLEGHFQKSVVGLPFPRYEEWIKKVFRVGDSQNNNNNALIERERQLVQLMEVITEQNNQIEHLTRSLREREPEISQINKSQPNTTSSHQVFECSIIIPVFNKVELTQQCLMHLAEVTKDISYEVVIVDNHSSDGTGEFLQALEGDVQVISNPENLGFAKACNQGAWTARGRHLVFLNNDTIPRQNWLEALVQEVEANSDVDVVGSKLLYPDDTIQHAGVVFSRLFLCPYHIFQGVPENFPAVNRRREYQAVTAACMLVRKDTFEKIGGFDEGFVNGFEDVDLCLKVRQLGKMVVYQPRSCLYHLESQSSGRKDHDEENAQRLLDRWKHQWRTDEDIVAYQDDYIIQQYVAEGKLRAKLTHLNLIPDSTVWKRVVDLQQLLFGQECQPLVQMNDSGKIRNLLADVEGWPNDLGILEWVGRVCDTLCCESEAKQFWEKLLAIGDHPNARLGLARASLKNGCLDEAQKHLDVLKRDFNPREEGWALQGILFMQDQKYHEAKQAFEQVLAIDVEHRKALMGLGMAWMGLGESAEAWNMFEQVMSLDPDDIEAIRCLIQAGTALQDWEGLGSHLARYVERNPADCDMRFALAGVEFRADHHEKAREQLTWLKLVNPGYEGLDDLERLLQLAQPQGGCVPTR